MSKMHGRQIPEGILGFDTLYFGTQFAVTMSASPLLTSLAAFSPCSFKHTQHTFARNSSCDSGGGILCAMYVICRTTETSAEPLAAGSQLSFPQSTTTRWSYYHPRLVPNTTLLTTGQTTNLHSYPLWVKSCRNPEIRRPSLRMAKKMQTLPKMAKSAKT